MKFGAGVDGVTGMLAAGGAGAVAAAGGGTCTDGGVAMGISVNSALNAPGDSGAACDEVDEAEAVGGEAATGAGGCWK